MKKNFIATTLLILITLVITIAIFKPVIQHPNSYLFSNNGDAIKSYFNFSDYLKYDTGIKFDGINYPYGEHLQYDNTHPFHSVVFKFVDKFVDVSPYGVAILNLMMIFALALAVPFIFLILRYYKLPVWYSFIVALIILFLSPQLDRIKGHFEMVYLYFIPMYWYFLLKFRKGKRPWLWAVLLISTGVIGGFTSAYFAAFFSIFLFSVLLADLWFKRKNLKEYIRPGITLFIMAVMPLIIVKGVVGITDWANDRPFNPWGFYVFHANISSIFMPTSFPFHEMFFKWSKISWEWEGRAYVGLPATILAILITIKFVRNLFTKRKSIPFFQNENLNVYLLGATLVLLFAMCFPFKYGFGFLLDLLPPVKQFRALGRFAWIFYYVFTVYAAYYFYHLSLKLKENGSGKKSITLLVLVLVFWSYDAVLNAKNSFSGIFFDNNTIESSDAEYQQILKEANINASDFQAIFFLPFSNTSGDKLNFDGGRNIAFGEAMRCAYHTGLPLVQSYSPRLPFSDALSTVQLLADSSIRKTRLDDMNQQPLLLVSTHEKMNRSEQWLINHSKQLYSDDRVTLSRVELSSFHRSYKNWQNYVDTTVVKLTGNEITKADIPLNQLVVLDFDQFESENIFAGKGAKFKRRKTMQVFDENFAEKGLTGDYRLSFWMFFDNRIYDMPRPFINIANNNGNVEETIWLNNRAIHNVYNHWVLIEQDINLQPGKRYQLEIKGRYITIDKLLLQPKGSNVWEKTAEGKKWLNNFAID